MQEEKRTALPDARKHRELLTEVLAKVKFLDGLEAEALSSAERFGPIRGRIRSKQRIWSWALDQIEGLRQNSSVEGRAA
jgi:hypothetical protein